MNFINWLQSNGSAAVAFAFGIFGVICFFYARYAIKKADNAEAQLQNERISSIAKDNKAKAMVEPLQDSIDYVHNRHHSDDDHS